ncbi:hypothetical protein Cadr_000022898 [Camelus dromedarius]|uniref:Uncharacterized protein n=1 Tax=Camelus dromedarius TaxID=9838 RepID=A0A5N4CHF5_CAMDR|nr:hypothetical protein Cadr_000022898 [Camelus dromedarius]
MAARAVDALECGHSVPEQLRVEPTLCPSCTTDSSSQEKPAPASSPGADTIPSWHLVCSNTKLSGVAV